MIELTFGNDIGELSELLARVEASPWYQRMEAKRGYILSLALEEMISNIIKYGYDDDAAHTIQVNLDPLDDGIHVTIIDDGHEFNPLLDAAGAEVNCDLACRPVGGVGILLTKKLSRKVEYRRDGCKNVLTILI